MLQQSTRANKIVFVHIQTIRHMPFPFHIDSYKDTKIFLHFFIELIDSNVVEFLLSKV